MIRICIVVFIWLITLCVADIDVEWKDGLSLHLTGWWNEIGRQKRGPR